MARCVSKSGPKGPSCIPKSAVNARGVPQAALKGPYVPQSSPKASFVPDRGQKPILYPEVALIAPFVPKGGSQEGVHYPKAPLNAHFVHKSSLEGLAGTQKRS